MKIIDPGHVYDLNWLDGKPNDYGDAEIFAQEKIDPQNRLTFVKRKGPKYPGNTDAHLGTTMQEVLRAVIDRLKYVNKQEPHGSNDVTLKHLRSAIYSLELRAALRAGRDAAPLGHYSCIERAATCSTCGHINCSGHGK